MLVWWFGHGTTLVDCARQSGVDNLNGTAFRTADGLILVSLGERTSALIVLKSHANVAQTIATTECSNRTVGTAMTKITTHTLHLFVRIVKKWLTC